MKEQGFEDLALLLLHRMNSALKFLRHQPLAKASSMSRKPTIALLPLDLSLPTCKPLRLLQ